MADTFGAPETGQPDSRVNQTAHTSGGGFIAQALRDVNVFQLDERFGKDALPARVLAPARANPLLGRDADLAALAAAFDAGQGGADTVVLTGLRALRGLGRTALALQFAEQALSEGRYPGGAAYVNLAEQETGKAVDAHRALPNLLAITGTEIAAIPMTAMQQLAMYRTRSSLFTKSNGAMLLILDGVSSRQQLEVLRPDGEHNLLIIPHTQLDPEVGTVEVTIGPLDSDSSVALLRRSLADRNPHFAGPRNEYKLLRAGWIAAGLPKVLELMAHHLAERPETDLTDLVGELAETIDTLPARPAAASPALFDAARLLGAHSPGGEAVVPPPELVGRVAVTKWITEDWRAGRPARWEIAGGSGTGKTSLLNALAHRLRELAGSAIIMVSADLLAQKLEVAAREPDQDVDIMPFCIATIEDIARDIGPVLPSIAQDLYNLRLTAKTPEEVLEHTVVFLKNAAGDGETGRRLAFLTDNIDDALLPDSCRMWLLRLATEVGCPVVASLKPTTTTWMHASVRLRLAKIGVEQLERLATGTDGTPLLTHEQALRLIELTKGLPSSVAAALTPIRRRPRNVDKHLDLYEEKSLTGGIEAADLFNARQEIDEISREHAGRAEQDLDLFDLIAVLRTFDAELLTALLARHELDERAAERLVEQVTGLRSVITDLDSSGRYQMHSRFVETRTAEMSAKHRRRLHVHVEKVVYDALDGFEPGEAVIAEQVAWTKFEDPDWNELAVEWFYHAAMSQEATISRAMRVRMSLLYFRAMWWYGWFAPVYICEMTPMEALRLTGHGSAADKGWAHALAQVQAGYPHTWDKDGASPGDWQTTAEGLRYLLQQLQLKPDAAEPDREAIELAVYLNGFLADCARYKPDSTTGTPKTYNDAARRLGRIVFDSEDDAWNFPWFDIFDAEAFVVSGDLRAARKMLKSVLTHDDDDNDLRRRFLLVASQIARQRGDLTHAVALSMRGTLRAYVYNVVQEAVNQAPSRYSFNVHEESMAELKLALGELRAQAPAQYPAAAAKIVEYFEPYWRDAFAEQVAAEPGLWTADAAAQLPTEEMLARFVPQPPADVDLGRKDSDYALRAGKIYERMEPEFAWPPRGWQPAPGDSIRRAVRRLTVRRPQPAY